jgi:hypothetical protein
MDCQIATLRQKKGVLNENAGQCSPWLPCKKTCLDISPDDGATIVTVAPTASVRRRPYCSFVHPARTVNDIRHQCHLLKRNTLSFRKLRKQLSGIYSLENDGCRVKPSCRIWSPPVLQQQMACMSNLGLLSYIRPLSGFRVASLALMYFAHTVLIGPSALQPRHLAGFQYVGLTLRTITCLLPSQSQIVQCSIFSVKLLQFEVDNVHLGR